MGLEWKDKSLIMFTSSNLRLKFETHPRRFVPGKLLYRRNFKVRADVNYVNAEEAKKLVAVDGYAIVDVRDKTQFERAHIKSCYHIPMFIENKDNDPGKTCFHLMCYLCLNSSCELGLVCV